MNAPASTLRGVVLVEPHLPPPLFIVTTRRGGIERNSRAFTNAAEAREYGLGLAELAGLLFVDLTATPADD